MTTAIASQFTAEQREELAREHLAWGEAALAKKFGPESAEYAGLALVRAMDTYQESRGEFRAWLYQNLIWTSREQHRAFAGRVGSRQHNARTRTVSVADNDRVVRAGSDDLRSQATTSPDQGAIAHDDLINTLAAIEELPIPQRWVILGRFAGLSDDDIGRITGREPHHFSRSVNAAIRRFV
jgi:DNA-directed RNA polymerase specialized sigma24 family protein